MSRYIPKPDLHRVNIERQENITDMVVLFLATHVLIIGVLFAVSYTIQLVAVRVAPDVEQSWLRGLMDFAPGRAIEHPELLAILEKARPKDFPYDVRFKVECEDELNAYALPGATVVFTKGLMEKITTEQSMAFIAGHEMGHLKNRDHLRGAGLWFTFMVAKIFVGAGELPFFEELQLLMLSAYSRDQETEADRFSLERMHERYGSAKGAEEFFKVLMEEEAKAGGNDGLWFLSSHPLTPVRLETIKTWAMDHKDIPVRNIRALQRQVLCDVGCSSECRQ